MAAAQRPVLLAADKPMRNRPCLLEVNNTKGLAISFSPYFWR